MPKYQAPGYEMGHFTCPFCDTLASQVWRALVWVDDGGLYTIIGGYCTCSACKEESLWTKEDGKMVHPLAGQGPPANEDMPKPILDVYREALGVSAISERAAAALLRLALDLLCDYLKAEGSDLNAKIGDLVAKGLPSAIQKAADSVRISGNVAVHPGEIVADDEPGSVGILFDMINVIVADRIEKPRKLNEFYAGLDEKKRKAIEKRDGKATAPEPENEG